MKYLLAWIRIVLCVLIIAFFITGLVIISFFFGKDIRRAFRIRRACVKILNAVLGYKIHTNGHINPVHPAIYISNHRCFSDPILALQYFDFYPIGKAEIEKYPLIGFGARQTGILFVQRDNRESRNQVKEGMKTALQQGLSIFLCPEGTTNVAQTTKDFKLGAFDVAAELNIPIIPLAMVYHDPAKDFWIPTDSLIQHFIRQFGKWSTEVDIYFPERPFSSSDPIVLMHQCKEWIDDKLLSVTVPPEVAALAKYNLKV